MSGSRSTRSGFPLIQPGEHGKILTKEETVAVEDEVGATVTVDPVPKWLKNCLPTPKLVLTPGVITEFKSRKLRHRVEHAQN